MHYATLHYTTLHYITLHYITLNYTTLRFTTLHYITLHYITLHYITLHYITLHYITLHYITLHYITLHYIYRNIFGIYEQTATKPENKKRFNFRQKLSRIEGAPCEEHEPCYKRGFRICRDLLYITPSAAPRVHHGCIIHLNSI